MSYIGEYDAKLVTLSIIVAIIGSYASLDIVKRVKSNVKNELMKGLLIGSVTFGLGCWTMHFMGLMGYDAPGEMVFDLHLTLLSLVSPIIISFIAFIIMHQSQGKIIKLLVASFVMGFAIAGMHFLGMLSMHINVGMRFNIFIVILACVFGFAASFVSFLLLCHMKHGKLISSVLLGIGISTMHYTAMRAMVLSGDSQMIHHHMMSFEELPYQFSRNEMAFGIAIVTIFIIIIIVYLAYMDKRNVEKLQKVTEQNYQEDLNEYKERIKKAQRNLIETIQKQQGMILKYIKLGDHFIHTLSEGKLLYKIGLEPSLVVGKSLFEFLPMEEAIRKNDHYAKAWEGELVSYEGDLNGVIYLAQLNPVFENGKVKEVIVSGIDITAKVKAERALQKERDYYENILSTMSEGIFTYGSNDEKVVLNDNVYTMFSMGKEEFAKQTLANMTLQFIDENGSPFTNETLPIAYTLTTGKPLFNEIMGIKGENNECRWLSVNTRLLQNDYQNSEVLLTMSDITLQKKHELEVKETYDLGELIFNNLYIGILILDANRNVILLNERLRSLFHIQESVSDIIGRHVVDHHPSFFQDAEEEYDRVKKIIKEQQSVTDEIKFVGDKILIRNYTPIKIGGELQGHLWTFEDITERKRLEQDRIKAKEEAIQANFAKSEFLSKMSHELRTPLNGVLGFSQLLELDTTLSEQQQSFVQEILKGGRHLLNLINEVLDLARIESGKLKVTLEYVNVTDLISECIHMLQPVADQKNIGIMAELSNAQNNYVYCDPLRLRQIVINLIDNAIKYNVENGKVTILFEGQAGQTLIRIKDTGIGIPEEEQMKIFDPFYRINTVNVEGTGIGLSIVKQLVQLMNGRMGLFSGEESGSEFWFCLPSGSHPEDHKKIMKKELDRSMECKKESKILYIEDNLANIQLVKQILGSVENATLQTAVTGEEGMDFIQKNDYDLILLDINLPGMSGYNVIKIIKTSDRTKQIPVIALSAYAMTDDIQKANENGFSGYITKPIDITYFLEVVSKYL